MTTIKSILFQKIRKFVIPALTLFMFVRQAEATTYFTRMNGANWSTNTTWSTVTYSGAAAVGHPVAGDTVNIANGVTVFINTSSACSVINIGQGTSGILQFGSTGNFTLTVSGDVNVSTGAKLYYNSNNTRTHTLKIGGNLINNGIVDLMYDVNDKVNIIFDGGNNSVVSGAGTWSINNVTLNKTTSSDELVVSSSGFETAIASLITTEGTYIHNNNGTYSINASAGSNFVISETVVFKIPLGTVWFSANSNSLYLEGSLYVNGGAVFVGTTAGNNGLIYRQPGSVIPYLEVTAGTLDVYGGIYNNMADPFSFKMTGGTILLNNGSAGTSQGVFYQNDLTGSVFYMSGGTIIIEKHNSVGATNVDWGICGTNGVVITTGGTIQFGDNATPSGSTFDFQVFPNVVQPNFKVTGTAAAAISLQPTKSAVADFKLLSLFIDVNKTFDIRSIQGVNGDNKTMTLTSTYNGVTAFNNNGTFIARSGNLKLTGGSPQSIGGSSVTTFYNLTMNTSTDATLASPEKVSNFLSMTTGKLITTSTNLLTCTSTANANIGSSTSYVDGPMVQTVATVGPTTKTFPIGDGNAYRPAVLTISHLTATSVTYKGEVINSSAAALGYNLPPTLAKVSSTRYWDFTRQNVFNFNTAVVQLYYAVDDSVADKMSVSIVHDDGSFNWVDYGGTGTANVTGKITSNTITSFKQKFALGFPPTSLPIELISFYAKNSEGQVRCEWTTATETNNDYFTIERSANGIKYDSILYKDGAGNSSSTLYYTSVDDAPLKGDSYYRLKQTNFDGKFSCSDPVHVYLKENNASRYKIFPNPSEGNLILIGKNGEDLNNAEVVVHDLAGKEVKSLAMLSGNKKELQLSIDPSSLNRNSAYIVSILTGDEIVKEKVLINKH